MRYAFLGLMCVFACIYAAIRKKANFVARLTVKVIASTMFVLVAFAGRVDAAYPYYYGLILTGLCLSLAGDVLLLFSGPAKIAGGIAFSLAHIGYIGAFFIYAAPAWYDAVLFAVFAAMGAAVFAREQANLGRIRPLLYIYAALLCAMASKAFSMLFARGVKPIYAAFAALGGVLFAISDLALAHTHIHPDQGKRMGILSTLTYYAAQALIALSIAL